MRTEWVREPLSLRSRDCITLLIADMSKAVDRHIIEQRWRKEGALDLLVCRLILYSLIHSFPSHPSDGTYSPNACHSRRTARPSPVVRPPHFLPGAPNEGGVESTEIQVCGARGLSPARPGLLFLIEPTALLNMKKTINPPRLHKDVFHTDERLYTLIMVDPGD